MQYFVLVFDCLVMVYYIYQMPCWDCIKSKFPFFQYEAKTAEKADCTNFLLTVMFIIISKVSVVKAQADCLPSFSNLVNLSVSSMGM